MSVQKTVKLKVPKTIKFWIGQAKVAGRQGERKFWMDAIRSGMEAEKQLRKVTREDRAANNS